MAERESSAAALAAAWRHFRQDYGKRLENFHRELTEAWRDLEEALDQAGAAFEAAVERKFEPEQISSLRLCFAETAETLLPAPVSSRTRIRPQLRALNALSDLQEGLEDLIRRLPPSAVVSPAQLAEVLGPEARRSLRRRFAGWFRKHKPLQLRRVVAALVRAENLRRARLDGEFQLLLARASLHQLGPWHAYRQRSLLFLEDPGEEPLDVGRLHQRWLHRRRRYADRAARLLDSYARWRQSAPQRLVRRLLAAPRLSRRARPEKAAVKLQNYFSFWSRQQRAVQALGSLEVELARVATRAVAAAEELLASLDQEHENLTRELAAVLTALESRPDSDSAVKLPPPQAEMLSAEARWERFARQVGLAAKAELPVTIEAIEPRHGLPGWRRPWKRLEPQAIFLGNFHRACRSIIGEGLQQAESSHRAILREIERAREVVAFGLEAAQQEGEDAGQIVRQSIDNAIRLLRDQQQHLSGVRAPAERALTQGIAAGLLACYITLDQGRLGLLRQLLQETGERGLRKTRLLGAHGLHRGTSLARNYLRRFYAQILYRLGLSAPPAPPAAAVSRTHRLEDLLELHVIRTPLPLLYRRLFRLEPVEDPRFLVGRDDEMAGLVEARVQWMTGKPVAILVVGARGSGKTSLLNCAALVAFADLKTYRGQFADRILSAAAMDRFLHNLLELPGDSSLTDQLGRDQQLIVLEEVERTFLRCLNGFEGLRFLLELIAHTWHSTLWVLSMNETAFVYLSRALDLPKFFSHRINAMAVRPDDLKNAILQRHNLSGFRLAFAPPPAGDPRINRLRQSLGLDKDVQRLFFDALYDHSEGIFRSAFELWQREIERVEGGVVYMRQPAKPDFGPLLSALTLDDCFTLHAILQHGGLTTQNLAEIFSETDRASRIRLERLSAFELIEPDPAGPGFRVRPEAGRVVREALHRQNLT